MTSERSGDRPSRTIGIIATLGDYAQMAQALTADWRTVMLERQSAVAAVRDNSLDLLIVAPRDDWWAERIELSDLQAATARARTTVIAMVPRGDSAALAAAFDSGVADCVAYPFDPAEVAVRVGVVLRRKATADRRRNDVDEFRRLALTDPVTRLWNRRYLDDDLVAKIEHATTRARPLSLLMMDIDRFKPINDRHGHAIGDQVLRAVATRLAGGIRSGDTLARFGGDELALIMPDTALDVAMVAAERLRALVASTTEVPFTVTISAGVAEHLFEESASEFIARADKALYAAKMAGRDRIAAAS